MELTQNNVLNMDRKPGCVCVCVLPGSFRGTGAFFQFKIENRKDILTQHY